MFISRPVALRIAVLAAPLFAGYAWISAEDDPDAVAGEMKRDIGRGAAARRVGPFVACGDLDPDAMDRVTGTIDRARAAFAKQFFRTPPDKDLRVYLFPDAASYESFIRRKYVRPPSSPYGFYLPQSRSLVMNIGTGTGTLVHEMAHALADFDFPDIPAWFNEGFASLFEQSRFEDGKIRGLVNWRLKGLQKGLAEGAFLPFEKLTSFTGREFYEGESGFRYAEARHLCLWLQEQGLLETYYAKFREARTTDPTGFVTLQAVLGRPVAEVEADIIEWAGKLRLSAQ